MYMRMNRDLLFHYQRFGIGRYKVFDKLSIPRIPVTINEYGSYWHSVPGYPGAHVSWIANLERNNVTSAMHACWHETPFDSCDTCSNASLNGLLTCEETPRPRSHWHVYKAYGDMSGRFIVTDQRLAGTHSQIHARLIFFYIIS